jgi:phytoene dehydrogenase-like protein
VATLDAVVVGSGPNGLAAAVTLTAAGLRVLVLEGAPSHGGGCRTAELTLPGFWHDVCATAHPLAVASPFFRRFDLAARGVRFGYPDVQFAHPLDGGQAAMVTGSVADTAAWLGPDAHAYRRLFGPLAGPTRDPGVAPTENNALTDLLLGPVRLPPARYPRGLATFAVQGLRGADTLARRFRTPQARALVAGAAAHAMMPLSAPLTGATGLILVALAHTAGWPFVRGGSARITDALLAAVLAGGGRIETGCWVRSLDELPPAKVVLLDVTPTALAALAGDRLPAGYLRWVDRFRYGPGVCKVDFALSGPVPWSNEGCRRAGILHLGGTFEQIAAAEADVAAGRHSASPYVLAGQPGTADPTRAPAGQHTLWAYCHVPSGSDVDVSAAVEAQIERFAPGFGDLVLARAVRTAANLQAYNPNYIGGDIGAGRQALRQRLLGPVPRWNPYRTPARGVYLCSSSVPPMPGVHGRCGELAALTALRDVFGVRDMPTLSPGAAEPARRARSLREGP